MNSGLYIVTLANRDPISVNRGDRRIEHRCLHVTHAHCKIGRARDFAHRRRGYERVFGEHVRFTPLFALADIASAERIVLAELDAWRVRGRTGRRNEWLGGIAPAEVERIARAALTRRAIPFVELGTLVAAPSLARMS